MVYENRLPVNFSFGTLSTAAAIGDTTLSSAEFATALPAGLSTTTYVPMSVQDITTRAFEVVWVTGHAAAATTATVVRGREGATAQAWPAGTQWLVGPTVRDGILPVANRAALPTDAHTGMRCFIQDEQLTIERSAVCWGWPTAMVRATGTQTIPSELPTPLRFNVEDIDNANGHDNAVNNSRYTVKMAGWYQLSGHTSVQVGTEFHCLCSWYKNGALLPSGGGIVGPIHSTTVAGIYPAATVIASFVVGDYIELWMYQDDGQPLDTASSSVAYQPYMAIRHLGGL